MYTDYQVVYYRTLPIMHSQIIRVHGLYGLNSPNGSQLSGRTTSIRFNNSQPDNAQPNIAQIDKPCTNKSHFSRNRKLRSFVSISDSLDLNDPNIVKVVPSFCCLPSPYHHYLSSYSTPIGSAQRSFVIVITISLLTMDINSNNPGTMKKPRQDMAKKYKLAPQFSIPEGVSKRTELLNNRRKIVKTSIIDASRDVEKPVEEVKNPKEQNKQRFLERKQKKENQEKEPAKKLKPFLSGTVKVPLYYVPPPPLPKMKQKDKVVNANKQVPNIPKISESNVSKFQKYQWLQFISSKKEKYQSVSKIGRPKSQAGPNYKSKLGTKKGSDIEIAEKVVSAEDATITKLETQFKSEIDRIGKMCASWDKILKTSKLPNFVQSLVLGATGQGRLLVSQKMAQFRSLLETKKKQNCPGTSGETRLLSQDLLGFWDMVYLQVKDIDKRFSELEKLKTNNWKEEKSTENKKPSKKGCTNSAVKLQKKPAMRSHIRGLILEARKRMTKKHTGNEEAGVETCEAESFTIQWATKTTDVQLELPSTSGIVPAQFASEPGASSSTNIPFKDQEPDKTRRVKLEPLEQEKNVKGSKKHKTGDALETEKNLQEMPTKKNDICFIKLEPKN